jgi:hypothetical protein
MAVRGTNFQSRNPIGIRVVAKPLVLHLLIRYSTERNFKTTYFQTEKMFANLSLVP